MAKFKLVVLSNAKEGREDEYNAWYNNLHLADVVAVPGFVSAQRFKLRNDMGFAHGQRYLAIYEMAADDPQVVIDEMMSRTGTAAMFVSEALDLDTTVAGLFEPCSPIVNSKARTRPTKASSSQDRNRERSGQLVDHFPPSPLPDRRLRMPTGKSL